MSVKPTPEELLSRLEAEEEQASRGRLKVFLGYASGVGKSFRMFDEGRRRSERGEDVIVGATQPRNSPELANLIQQLEILPARMIGGIPVVDVEAILKRRPQVVLIDGLAHDNPPGHRTAYRWQDVERLLQHGISVITTINLKFVAERRAQIGETGEGESVPESFLRKAEEMVVVDAPLTGQSERLAELREIALLLAADVVDAQLERYLARSGVTAARGGQERILVWLTSRSDAKRMIERASVARERFHGVLYAIYVCDERMSQIEKAALEERLQVARAAGVSLVCLDGEDQVESVLKFARTEGITQIYVSREPISRWQSWLGSTPAERLIARAEWIDVKLFPQ